MNPSLPETIRPEATEETLRLKCPTCGGGLNLKRRHLGITGQCVHCQTPLTALEWNGAIQVVAGLNPRLAPEAPEPTAAPPEISTPPAPAAPAGFSSHAAPSFGSFEPTPPVTAPAAPASSWGFPDRETVATATPEEEIPLSVLASAAPLAAEETPAPSFDAIRPETSNLFGTSTQSTESTFPASPLAPISGTALFPTMPSTGSPTGASNLLVDRNEVSDAVLPPAPAFQESALFGGGTGGQKGSFSSMFKNDDDSSEINPAWGTKVPQENHASISPFATGSASGGGFAESLFREKVVKESEKNESPLFASPFPPKEEKIKAPAKEEFQKKVVLDGDGRPMRPMTSEEEANFAKHLFAIEKTHKRPRWVKKVIQFAVTISILGAIGTGVYFLTPEEKLAEWKTKAYNWLEPGLAILDYVPEGLRPDWLPRTSLGIDAGVDENGVPKKKLNAFEGLDKLKGDIGNMRGTAEDELKNINKF